MRIVSPISASVGTVLKVRELIRGDRVSCASKGPRIDPKLIGVDAIVKPNAGGNVVDDSSVDILTFPNLKRMVVEGRTVSERGQQLGSSQASR